MNNKIALKSNFFCLIFLFVFSLLIIPTQARGSYPELKNEYINDFAGVVEKTDKKGIIKLLVALERETGIEAIAITIKTYKNYKTKAHSVSEFATGLFNEWSIGNKKKNKAILLLLDLKHRAFRIKLGKGHGSELNRKMKPFIKYSIIPMLKKKQYSQALYKGANRIVQRLTIKKESWFKLHKWDFIVGAFIIICILALINCIKQGKAGWGWIFFTIVGTVLIALMSNRRNRYHGGFGGGSSGSW